MGANKCAKPIVFFIFCSRKSCNTRKALLRKQTNQNIFLHFQHTEFVYQFATVLNGTYSQKSLCTRLSWCCINVDSTGFPMRSFQGWLRRFKVYTLFHKFCAVQQRVQGFTEARHASKKKVELPLAVKHVGKGKAHT